MRKFAVPAPELSTDEAGLFKGGRCSDFRRAALPVQGDHANTGIVYAERFLRKAVN
jgi:hypothetical protein